MPVASAHIAHTTSMPLHTAAHHGVGRNPAIVRNADPGFASYVGNWKIVRDALGNEKLAFVVHVATPELERKSVYQLSPKFEDKLPSSKNFEFPLPAQPTMQYVDSEPVEDKRDRRKQTKPKWPIPIMIDGDDLLVLEAKNCPFEFGNGRILPADALDGLNPVNGDIIAQREFVPTLSDRSRLSRLRGKQVRATVICERDGDLVTYGSRRVLIGENGTIQLF